MTIGTVYGPFETVVDAGRAAAFARAIGQRASPDVIPPTFIAAATREVMLHAMTQAVPAGQQRGGVHGEQDMTWYRPLLPGMALVTTAEVRAVRSGPTGSRLTVLIRSRESAGSVVADQLWTTFFRGADLGPDDGPTPPDHSVPPPPLSGIFRCEVPIDPDQPARYADASGEDSAIHVDAAAARAAGFRTIVGHGMLSLALCAEALLAEWAGSEPWWMRRLAVRFAGAAYPGSSLQLIAFPLPGGDGYAFEARSPDGPVLSHGRLELQDP